MHEHHPNEMIRIRPPCPPPKPFPPAARPAKSRISSWQANEVLRAMAPHVQWFDGLKDRMREAGLETDPAYWPVWHVCHAAEELRLRMLFRDGCYDDFPSDLDASRWCGEGI